MSNFVVSARKYRPVRFDEVVGQQHVSQTLKNALLTDHLAHAFLFCGPRGVGKTTSARILAKVLNCLNRTADFEPCNQCDSCVSFDDNANVYIRELDAASNNSVDHIRSLNEQARIPLDKGKSRVFIVDEVHMLSQAAFNAFLKTLEEPPPNTIFILATTEKHKIIPTILSRCQVFDFKRIQPADIVLHLQDICQQEQIAAEEDALHIIAQKADGALRDALSIFDRIVSFTGNSITYDAVIENLNVLDYDYFFRAVDFVLTEDRAGMLLLFDEILQKGFDEDLFLNGLAAHVRDLLVCKDTATLQLLEVGERLRERYHQQAAISPPDLLLTILDVANDCDLGFRMARNKRLHVEMSLLRMVSIKRAFRNDAPTSPALASPSPAPALSAQNPEKKNPDATHTVAGTGAAGGQLATGGDDDHELEAPQVKKTTPPAPTVFQSINLQDMLAEIAQESASNAVVTQLPELSAASLQRAWENFLQKNEGSTLALHLQMAEAQLEGEEVVVNIGSQRVMASLREDSTLIQYLRETFGRPTLVMRLEVDETLRPAQAPVKRRLTAKDKYLRMREKNPAIDDLRKRFDLRPEE
ncbi:DNA polymerase III subunit gamma/tau [Neolewinella lacunae]|uniref:DNA polymerase III subunit gamma/tau n=1 Tax=Neolewinella lacunae TaxID=1517758 RepID=A0A923PG10_9BACT|nr:DNA polymerase III subunit gamma/tau [Neolewinella lacunae]MBC6992564.1 DNA polymerase III subunit gamma/tau [Neolewinella lacunae]MDN3634306.1 DNA polymerase III subunit gamma/tau [Neolewinella lacunae]